MLQHSFRQARQRLLFSAFAVTLAGLALPWLSGRAPAENAPHEASNIVIDYADQMHRLVMGHKFEQLGSLKAPAATDPQVAELDRWRDQYVSRIAISQKQREEQYAKLVEKAQDHLQHNRLEEAIAQTVSAYTIAKDQQVFLALPWVQNLTKTIADQASAYEKQGKWLESLQLYSDLNTLYEIDTRYKADMQRLARRTRLLALYAPKVLLSMRKELTDKLEKERAAAATQGAATRPAEDGATATTR